MNYAASPWGEVQAGYTVMDMPSDKTVKYILLMDFGLFIVFTDGTDMRRKWIDVAFVQVAHRRHYESSAHHKRIK